MKKTVLVLASAVMGLLGCVAFVYLAQLADLSPHFPSNAGEDAFSVRFSYFLFGVCPAFLLLGGWIGLASMGRLRRWIVLFGGAAMGTVITFAGTRLVQDRLDLLSESLVTTHVVAVFYVIWVLLSVVGAVIADSITHE